MHDCVPSLVRSLDWSRLDRLEIHQSHSSGCRRRECWWAIESQACIRSSLMSISQSRERR